jgi:hypothetical protein
VANPLEKRRPGSSARQSKQCVQQFPFAFGPFYPIVMLPDLPYQLVEFALPAFLVHVLGLQACCDRGKLPPFLLLHAANLAKVGKDLGGKLR